jgi:hypothetical protein
MNILLLESVEGYELGFSVHEDDAMATSLRRHAVTVAQFFKQKLT